MGVCKVALTNLGKYNEGIFVAINASYLLDAIDFSETNTLYFPDFKGNLLKSPFIFENTEMKKYCLTLPIYCKDPEECYKKQCEFFENFEKEIA